MKVFQVLCCGNQIGIYQDIGTARAAVARTAYKSLTTPKDFDILVVVGHVAKEYCEIVNGENYGEENCGDFELRPFEHPKTVEVFAKCERVRTIEDKTQSSEVLRQIQENAPKPTPKKSRKNRDNK